MPSAMEGFFITSTPHDEISIFVLPHTGITGIRCTGTYDTKGIAEPSRIKYREQSIRSAIPDDQAFHAFEQIFISFRYQF